MLWPWEVPWSELLTKRFWIGEGTHRGALVDPLAAVVRDPEAAVSGAAMGAGAALAAAGAAKVGVGLAAAAAAKAAAAKAAAFQTALRGILAWELWQTLDIAQEGLRSRLRQPATPPPPLGPGGGRGGRPRLGTSACPQTGPVVRAMDMPASRPAAPPEAPGGFGFSQAALQALCSGRTVRLGAA